MRRMLIVAAVILVAQCGSFAKPAWAHVGTGIDVDRQGRFYFVDTIRNRVWRIETDGTLTTIATDAHFNSLLVHESGDVYLVEGNVWKIAPERSLIPVPDSTQTKLGLSDPFTIDRRGNLYFIRESQILKFTPEGILSPLTGGAESPAQGRHQRFTSLSSPAWGPDGSLYVKDGDAIHRIAPDGSASLVARGADAGFGDDENGDITPQRVVGLAADGQGIVYLANYATRHLLKIAPDGGVTTIHEPTWPWTPTGVVVAGNTIYILERFGNPYGLGAILSFGFLADLIGQPRIRKISPDGEVTTIATIANGPTRILTGAVIGIVVLALLIWRGRKQRSNL